MMLHFWSEVESFAQIFQKNMFLNRKVFTEEPGLNQGLLYYTYQENLDIFPFTST